MSPVDATRTIVDVVATGPARLHLTWSDSRQADIDLAEAVASAALATLRDDRVFRRVTVGDWGHSIEWPGGIELGADTLWRETLSATGHGDARDFLEWRMRHGLSLNGAAEALGISRRMVAYYSNGEKKVPKPILLACRGWEIDRAA